MALLNDDASQRRDRNLLNVDGWIKLLVWRLVHLLKRGKKLQARQRWSDMRAHVEKTMCCAQLLHTSGSLVGGKNTQVANDLVALIASVERARLQALALSMCTPVPLFCNSKSQGMKVLAWPCDDKVHGAKATSVAHVCFIGLGRCTRLPMDGDHKVKVLRPML